MITGRTPERRAEAVKPAVERFRRERGLARSSTKPRITPISAGFDLLGHTMRQDAGKLLTRPSPKRVNARLGQVRDRSKAHPQANAGDLIRPLHPLMRGGANDHRHGARAPTLRNVDWPIAPMVWRGARRRHPTQSTAWVGQQYCPPTGTRPPGFTGQRRNRAGDVQPIRR
ncbi:MAG: group II intron maturase-specific domain-containing protein [Candidatus Entotheonellia bacterium]